MSENADLNPTRWSLIERLKDWDDQESWRDFFEIYWKLIYSVAVKTGLNDAEAQEAVQETLISVCRNIGKFRADPARGSFKAWLLKLTRWRVLDQIRKRPPIEQARVHRPNRAGGADSASTATEERIPDPAGNLLDAIWDEEWEQNLTRAALERLKLQASAKHFQIYHHYVIKGLDPAKVAQALGVKIDQVYLVKNRLTPLFRHAVEEIRTQML
jgi:RNA polymerase sigma factor (sigma-70 family)